MLNLWQHPHLQQLNKLFAAEGYSLRIVGGAVRDAVLGVPSKDVDLCTNALPSEMMALAEHADIRCIPTGLQHGTVTFVIEGEPYEITTLRIDTDTDGRHATVEFTRDFQLDAARRDFTWNAMSVDAEGSLYDYFGGVEHLQLREIHFVGNAAERVREDFLRVLRFFRFAARYGYTVDTDTLEMFSQQWVHDGLAGISKERVWAEMSKLLVSFDRLRMVQFMWATGLCKAVGMQQSVQVDAFNLANDAVSALSVMTVDGESMARTWKMSTAERNKLVYLVNTRLVCTPLSTALMGVSKLDFVEDQLAFHRQPREWVVSLARMYLNEDAAYLAATWEVPQFPVNGAMLAERGFAQGPEMGKALSAMREQWRDSRYTLTASDFMASYG